MGWGQSKYIEDYFSKNSPLDFKDYDKYFLEEAKRLKEANFRIYKCPSCIEVKRENFGFVGVYPVSYTHLTLPTKA